MDKQKQQLTSYRDHLKLMAHKPSQPGSALTSAVCLTSPDGSTTGILWSQTYAYDPWGNRTSVTAAGNGFMPTDGLPAAVNYEQASNRLTSVTTNAQFNPPSPNFEYDPAGNQTRVIQSNGVAQRYYYDAAGRLSQVITDDGASS